MTAKSHSSLAPPSRPADTTAAAAKVHREALRRLGLDGRARLTFALGDSLRAVTEAGVRYRHPDYDDRQVRLATMRLMLGEALFAEVFSGENVRP